MKFAPPKVLFTVIGAVAIAIGFLIVGPVSAADYDQQNYEFTKPAQGYEGRTPTGVGYCSYRNVPKKKCWTKKNGKKKCKVVGYTLEQFCQGRY